MPLAAVGCVAACDAEITTSKTRTGSAADTRKPARKNAVPSTDMLPSEIAAPRDRP
jgi:hypothetical protein